ncbi:acyltransferase family protein [Methylocystis iwaonis]|uniref:acyltransferase family protein n=1 Tax=Methylocystis iwaonis TaxID=2885079 RepID=UPI002E7B08FD|nr:acyltransferase family protein [Methylocystis iwaonis]
MLASTKAPLSAFPATRVDWVDYAKGWCIILVVMMHSTLGVEEALGQQSWLHGFIDWARPFRMPDFFLVAGLFLARTIEKPWPDFLDRKVLHFAYFFVLWTLIQGAPKLLLAGGDPLSILSDLAFAMIEPFGTLWFIYLLPIFFVTTKLLRPASPWAVLAAASALQMANVATHSTVIDEFAARYTYFYAGYIFAPRIFAFAEAARANLRRTIPALILWVVTNELAVRCGYSGLPAVSLLLGFAGAAAVVAFSVLLAEAHVLPSLAWLGARSMVVYLAFFLPMAATRIALLKTGLIVDGGVIALIVTAIAVHVPIFVRTATPATPFEFLFERPAFFRTGAARLPAHTGQQALSAARRQ